MSAEVLRVRDVVLWRGNFGTAPAERVVVTRIEATLTPHSKYGTSVSVIAWREVRADRCVVSLDNGHWAYGSQLAPLNT